MTDLLAYTDGACSGNPGPGGWGALLIAKDGTQVLKERELKGGEAITTNNRIQFSLFSPFSQVDSIFLERLALFFRIRIIDVFTTAKTIN